jgi:hypothetical protein
MTSVDGLRRLGRDEFYQCPFPHVHPRHKQVFFRDFDAHFRVFGDRADHAAVAQLHEEIAWNSKRSASEKGKLNGSDLQRISLNAWLEAIKQQTGKPIQVIKK